MKPGRELDALVAEKLMGWKIVDFDEVKNKWHSIPFPIVVSRGDSLEVWYSNVSYQYWNPSNGIEAAWMVVEKTGLLNADYCLTKRDDKWIVGEYDQDGELWVSAKAETAPMVICLAALKAVGVSF